VHTYVELFNCTTHHSPQLSLYSLCLNFKAKFGINFTTYFVMQDATYQQSTHHNLIVLLIRRITENKCSTNSIDLDDRLHDVGDHGLATTNLF